MDTPAPDPKERSDGPRWLSEQEQETWRAYLSMERAVRRATARQLAEDSGMPPAYYEILVHLSEAEDRTLRMTALANATEGTPSQLSHAINRLQDRGWVERRRCREDARGWFAVLTDAGLRALQEAAPAHVECVRAVLFDPLTVQQQAQLRDIALAVSIQAAAPPD